MKCAMYDYETLSMNPLEAPVLSLAIVNFETDRFLDNPYSFEELIKLCSEYKFDVAHQVKEYGKKIDKGTLEWWNGQPKELRDRQMKPSENDLHTSEVYGIMVQYCKDCKVVYTRGNTYDPIITEQIMRDIGKGEPYPWWVIRDTRSLLEGMMWGSGMENKFIPEGLEEKFIAHDPRHDIAMDVMRIQTVVQAIS